METRIHLCMLNEDTLRYRGAGVIIVCLSVLKAAIQNNSEAYSALLVETPLLAVYREVFAEIRAGG